MIKLPTIADLNEVSQGLWGANFVDLSVPDKVLCVQMAQTALLTHVIDEVPLNISIGFAETVASWPMKSLTTIAEQLAEIDKSLGPIMEWFDKSRLYEP